MMVIARSWIKENSTLVYFLIGQFIAMGFGAASILAYSVKLETRVSIMETRGAEFTASRLSEMKDRITILEQKINQNGSQIERIVSVLTRDLGKPVPPP